MNREDLTIDVINSKRNGMQVAENLHNFVIIKHIPSGISVTKYHRRSQIIARDEALEELEFLVNLWECKF